MAGQLPAELSRDAGLARRSSRPSTASYDAFSMAFAIVYVPLIAALTPSLRNTSMLRGSETVQICHSMS